MQCNFYTVNMHVILLIVCQNKVWFLPIQKHALHRWKGFRRIFQNLCCYMCSLILVLWLLLYQLAHSYSLLFYFNRMESKRLLKHGTWMTVKRTRGFLITVSPKNSFLWTSFQVCTFLICTWTLVYKWKKFNFLFLKLKSLHLLYLELGIISWRLNPDNWEKDENLKKIREARGYSYMVCALRLAMMIHCLMF
jgi:hypothetical protein